MKVATFYQTEINNKQCLRTSIINVIVSQKGGYHGEVEFEMELY